MKKVHDNLYSQKLFPGHDKIPKNKRAVQKNTEDSYNQMLTNLKHFDKC